jgi:uncharacterized membrane protein
MRHRFVFVAIILLVLISPAVGTPTLAQGPGRGTTLACTGRGGDGHTLDEWTTEQVADYEDQSGHDVAEIAAHPVTGDCTDVAGLMGGWFPGTSWLCTPQSDGRWSGPGWVWSIYQSSNQVAPDPTTGRCPQPSTPYGAGHSELERAAATAVHLTELEVVGDYQRLYAWMHPDSKAMVPEETMEGWYREVFAVRTPTWMTVDDVRLVEWKWDVTGKVYPSAAEVTFRQRFEDGAETEGVTHLVRDNGVWRWFFGRDRAFIDELTAQFVGHQESNTSDDADRPPATLPATAATIDSVSYSILDLGTGNGNWSSASHINEQGQVLWTWATSQDPMTDRVGDPHPMMWSNGTTTDLSFLGIDYAIAINDTGMILVGKWGAESRRDFLYEIEAGTLTPVVAFTDGSAVDINDAGELIGWMNGTAAIASNGTAETIPISEGLTAVEPGSINDSGHLVGTAFETLMSPVNQRAMLFADGVVTVLDPAPGAESSSGDDLNDAGQVVGSPGLGGMHQIHQSGRAFLYDAGTGMTTDIGTLPGYQNSVASAINELGEVVGYAWLPENTADPIRRAYVYDHRTGATTDLNELISPGSGWYLVDAFDISDAGQIVGRGLIEGEMHAFLLTPAG